MRADMPNLEQYAVSAWLTELRPEPGHNDWPPAIRAIETEADIPQRIAALGSVLDDLAQGDLRPLSTALRDTPLRNDLTAVLSQLGAARVLRLLHWLCEIDVPDCRAVIAALLEDNGSAGQALRATVEAVTRRVVLRRIFAPERIAALELACAAVLEEPV